MTSKQEATRTLNELFEKVFIAASGGRHMTPELKTTVADAIYDTVNSLMDAVGEEYAIVHRERY